LFFLVLKKASPYVATKVTKKAVSRNASLPHMAFALQTGQNHPDSYRDQTLPLLRSLIAPASGKVRNALTTAQAAIVLPAFVRSLSADGGRKEYKYKKVCHPERSEGSIIGHLIYEWIKKIDSSLRSE